MSGRGQHLVKAAGFADQASAALGEGRLEDAHRLMTAAMMWHLTAVTEGAQWEYQARMWPPEHTPGLSLKESWEAYLNGLGAEGWELVTIAQGAAIYKRAIP